MMNDEAGREREAKVCMRCSRPFECGAPTGVCGCMDIQLTDEQRREVAARWADCLCWDCLREIAAGAMP